MATLQDVGRGLAGFGEGFQGRGSQFLAGIDKREADRKARLQKINKQQKERMARAGVEAARFADAGQLDQAVSFLDSQIQSVTAAGDDPLGLTELRDSITDSPQDAADDLRQFNAGMRADGFGPAAQQPREQIIDGQLVSVSGGRARATPIEGFQAKAGSIAATQVQSSQILPNGSTVQVFKDGSTRVTGPQGRVLTGAEREQGVAAAQEFGVDIQSRRAGGRAEATGRERRAGALIDRGLAAAESTAILRRGLELMETVKTGGPQALSLAVRQRFGIEGADEGELSNSLGKAVLTQLRETFGAAFTAEEGKSLARIEAGFGKSVATNQRLLNRALRIAERTARRAIKAARARGNDAEAADIEELLTFSVSPDAAPAGAATSPGAVVSPGIIEVDF